MSPAKEGVDDIREIGASETSAESPTTTTTEDTEDTEDAGEPEHGEAPAFPAVDKRSLEIEADEAKNVELLRDVSLRVRVELGRGAMYLRDILRLTQGSVVELEKHAGDPLDILVNNRLIARGEVLVLNDTFCVRITEILTPEECFRIKA